MADSNKKWYVLRAIGGKEKKAKEMLQCDYGSITDIALSLGYNNIYEFSKDFKKMQGCNRFIGSV